jgi:DNA-binding LytR/AlgR family response regulator
MVKVAIVEDEALYHEQLEAFLTQFKAEKDQPLEWSIYTDGDQFMDQYQSQFDIILLDIQMPLMDGMTVAEEIRKIDQHVIIIFITNMTQYAIKGYAVDALDYVLKPINYFAFKERLQKALERLEYKKSRFITVKVKGGMARLDLKDLYYIESQGHQLLFHTKDGLIESSGAIKHYEQELLADGFYRIHKGFIVNLNYVQGINDPFVVMKTTELPIGRTKKKGFLETLTKHWGDQSI